MPNDTQHQPTQYTIPPFPKDLIPSYNTGKIGLNQGVKPRYDAENQHNVALFKPFTMRSVTLKNRVVVSPMCQYSAVDGYVNAWHVAHYGQLAIRGPGMIIVEASGVLANGRITPNCLGIYSDSHIPGFTTLTSFMKSQNVVPAIQIAHAGRKASCQSPFFNSARDHNLVAGVEEGGWPEEVWGPSGEKGWESAAMPREVSKAEIAEVVEAFGRAAERAVKAGFEVLEIHGAHGYLINSFLSPLSNKRTDEYELGVDLLDCSAGGNSPLQKLPFGVAGPNVPRAERVRKETGLATGAVGGIASALQAEEIIRDGKADVVLLA
ncbi:hypothetical protein HDU76_006441, partial [Blyttiomyces sp. JEL0837]